MLLEVTNCILYCLSKIISCTSVLLVTTVEGSMVRCSLPFLLRRFFCFLQQFLFIFLSMMFRLLPNSHAMMIALDVDRNESMDSECETA